MPDIGGLPNHVHLPGEQVMTAGLVRAFPILAMLAISGCATVQVSERNEDRIIEHRERTTPPGEPSTWSYQVLTHADGKTGMKVSRGATCTRYTEETVQRVVRTERTIGTGESVLKLVGGAALLGAGAGVIYDAPNVPERDDPRKENPVGRTGAYAIGAATIALGAAVLAVATGDLVRSRDSVSAPVTISRRAEGSERSVACGETPAAGQALWLATAAGQRHPIGQTDDAGLITVLWKDLPSAWFAVRAPGSARVVRVEAGSTYQVLAGAGISLDGPAAIRRAASEEQAKQRLRAIEAQIGPALDKRDAGTARALVNEWKALDPQCTACVSAEARLSRLEQEIHLRDLWKAATSDDLSAAEGALAEIQKLTPADPRLGQVERRIQARREKADRVNAAQGVIEELCGVVANIDAVHRQLRFDERVTARSGLFSKEARQKQTAALVYLEDQEEALRKQLQRASVRFDRKAQCPRDEDQ